MSKEATEGIKIIRLVTGELLIGEFTINRNIESTIYFKNVAMLVDMPPQNQGEEPKLAFMPFMPFTTAQKSMEITTNNIVYTLDPVEQLLQAYQSQFSQIITPGKPQLLQPGK